MSGSEVVLHSTGANWRQVWAHHFADDTRERAAFFFLEVSYQDGRLVLTVVNTHYVETEEEESGSPYQISLAERVLPELIKRAHDTRTCLGEIHSHPFPGSACFSVVDVAGLRETVPHIQWRLPRSPYLAIVLAPNSFDALVWGSDDQQPVALSRWQAGARFYRPTGLTKRTWSE